MSHIKKDEEAIPAGKRGQGKCLEQGKDVAYGRNVRRQDTCDKILQGHRNGNGRKMCEIFILWNENRVLEEVLEMAT